MGGENGDDSGWEPPAPVCVPAPDGALSWLAVAGEFETVVSCGTFAPGAIEGSVGIDHLLAESLIVSTNRSHQLAKLTLLPSLLIATAEWKHSARLFPSFISAQHVHTLQLADVFGEAKFHFSAMLVGAQWTEPRVEDPAVNLGRLRTRHA
jgi:hypothetical protein